MDANKSKTVAKNTKGCLFSTSSIDFSLDKESTAADEDELPNDKLVYSISNHHFAKVNGRNNHTLTKLIRTKIYI
jgi:hypothetical protein